LWYRARGTVFALIYAAGFTIGYAGNHAAAPAFSQTWAAAVAALLMLAGILFRVWGSSYLHAQTVWSPDARNDAFVVDGPFRYTRNPLYFGNVVMALGFGLLAPLRGWLFIGLACTAYVVALIRWEELAMRMRYAGAYETYMRIVPMLLPRVTPAPARERIIPSLHQGITAEVFSAAFFCGMLVVLLTPAWGWWIFLLLLIAGSAAQRRLAGA
jgi:protein-S-isoprenylcysteine O-methyltransferase Ste14